MKKKITCYLIVICILISLCSTLFVGCTGQPSDPITNEVFTDDFFADVVEIRDSGSGVVSGQQMQPVIQYLQSLCLIQTDEHLSTTDEAGNILYGCNSITFKKSDGTEHVFLRNHTMITGADKCSYMIENGNLNTGLKDAFKKSGDQMLSIIKEYWTRYVVDRTDRVISAHLLPTNSLSFFPHLTEKKDISALLDICATLDLNALQANDPIPASDFYNTPYIVLKTGDDLDSLSFHINITPSGSTGIVIRTDGLEYIAYVNNWSAYDRLIEFIYSQK